MRILNRCAAILLLLASLRAGSSYALPSTTIGSSAQTQSVAPELASVQKLVDAAKLDEAESAARHYIDEHPKDPQGHFLLGLIYFRQVQAQARGSGIFLAPGEVPSAVSDAAARDAKVRASLAEFTEGGKLAQPSAFDLKIVSLDYVLLADYPSAAKWLTLALQWDPGDAEAWYYLGRAQYRQNRFDEAIHAFRQCLALRPHFVQAVDGLGLAQAGLGRTAEAITTLQAAISDQRQDPQKSPEPYIDLGDLLSQEARFAEAATALREAVTIAPKNIRAHEALGKAYLYLNRLPEAQHELQAAVTIDPAVPSSHYLLGQTYLKQGQREKAKEELELFQTLKAREAAPKSSATP